MPIELQLLAWTAVLGLVQLVAATIAARRQDSLEWAMGARDVARPALTGVAGRLARAQANFMETFPLFAAAVLIIVVANRSDGLTLWGAQLYFWSRLLYMPIYAAGIPYVRSVIWGASLAGLVLILYAALAG